MDIRPYLNFNGQCEEAFRFYERVLGGKSLGFHRFRGSPMEGHVPPEWADKVMHTGLQVGKQMILGSDPPPDRFHGMHGFAVCLDFDNEAEAERVFAALSEGGQVHMPIAETFWAKRFGMFVDRYGTPWMVDVPKPM